MKNQIIQGDALAVLRTLPDEYIQCIVTSPPYYSLRDYGVDGQIGLEDTPEEYIQKLVEVFHEARRVLRKDGVLWINIGDSYAGSGKGPTGYNGLGRQEERQGFHSPKVIIPHGLKPKDLMMIPARLAIALQQDGWWLRSDCIWNKPNCMPESVTDRPSTSHEHIFLLAKGEQYYYDADAIREPLRPKSFTTYGITNKESKGNDALGKVKADNWQRTIPIRHPKLTADGAIAGANKRSVWTIASHAYAEAHFATMPPKLVEPCILAGTSPKACEHCSAPWERVTVSTGHVNQREPAHAPFSSPTKTDSTGWVPTRLSTDQWQPTCLCKQGGTGKCIVLDPFMGAGTVALVSIQHGRDYLGIELNPEYIKLAQKRLACIQQALWTVEGEVAS